MTKLKLAPHSRLNDTIVEIWQCDENGLEKEMIGVVYPSSNGVKIISKYLENSSVSIDRSPPCSLNVVLKL